MKKRIFTEAEKKEILNLHYKNKLRRYVFEQNGDVTTTITTNEPASISDTNTTTTDSNTVTDTENVENISSQLIDGAKKHIGADYVFGSNGPSTFDCSGFVRYVLSTYGGLSLKGFPRKAMDIYNVVEKHDSSTTKPGDLVFFQKNGIVSHVGLVSSVVPREGKKPIINMIHAGTSSGVTETKYEGGIIENPYWGPKIKGFGTVKNV